MRPWVVLLLVVVTVLPGSLRAGGASLGFEGLSDGTILSSQFAGLIFANAVVLSSGITLNEFEFPPHSGANAASDNGGPITIAFNTPVQSFAGYFTYSKPLTLLAFNSAHVQVASATSKYSNNEVLSGVSGSSPNELLQVASAGGIASVTIAGDPAGNSFVLDDLTTPVFGLCDVNIDGAVNALDAQTLIAEALGMARAVHDLNNDSAVDVVELQIVVNASIGRGCTTTAIVTPNACDVNLDKSVNMLDAQTVIDEALGKNAAVHDLNHDAAVTVVEVQIVVNAAIGRGCSGS